MVTLRGRLVVGVRGLIFRLVDTMAKHPFTYPYPLPTDSIIAELGTNVLIPAQGVQADESTAT